MKIAFFSMALILVATGCSKKESVVAPTQAQFVLKAGDIASPVHVTTNKFGQFDVYKLSVEFSNDEQAKFREFEQAHLNQNIQILAGSEVLMTWHLSGVSSPSTMSLPYQTPDKALLIADSLTKLSSTK